jgi:succinate dehydrogenase flavin-adding protein (antitoxin of CptAB toxin-antitoxin module)
MSAREWKRLWRRAVAEKDHLRRRIHEWRAAPRGLRELELGRHPYGSILVLDYIHRLNTTSVPKHNSVPHFLPSSQP